MKKTGKRKKALAAVAAVSVLLVAATFVTAVCVLPLRNLIGAIAGEGKRVSESTMKFVRGGKRDYSGLPDVLTSVDGKKVSTPAEMDARRREIISLFEDNVYGRIPRDGFETSFRVVERGESPDGRALRKQIMMTVTTDRGSLDALMVLYTPKGAERCPVVMGLNFKGNHRCFADPAVLPSPSTGKADLRKLESQRGDTADRWCLEKIIGAGCGVATAAYGDFAPDSRRRCADGVSRLFKEDVPGISSWAFGLMRGVDWLVSDEDVDPAKIACVGHSRLGKTSLWAGANDERISLVISNDSGCGGAALARGSRGETVSAITLNFPHWFTDGYRKFAHRENRMPLDQHMLLAAVAPRKLYVASGNTDLWADPVNEYLSLKYASAAYGIYGLEIPDFPDSLPPPDTRTASGNVAHHVRTGGHGITPADWDLYLRFITENL